jgi:hypothetical protein
MDDASLILDPETSRKKQETGIVRILEREARIGAVCRAGLVRLVGEKRAEEVIRWAARVKPYVPNLEDYLLAWARVHLRKAAEAWAARDDDEEWENRVLASIVRARAVADVRWLFRVAEHPTLGPELAILGPWIVSAAGYPVAGSGLTFEGWVREVRGLAGYSV